MKFATDVLLVHPQLSVHCSQYLGCGTLSDPVVSYLSDNTKSSVVGRESGSAAAVPMGLGMVLMCPRHFH